METQSNSSQPSTAEILAEVERRRAEARRPESEENRRIIVFIDRCVFWLSKHWLAVLNALAFLYVGLPILSPVLLYLGATGPGSAIQIVYRPLCHQLPHRSWFLFGQKLYYSLSELMEIVGINSSPTQWINVMAVSQRIQYGNTTVGYKIALCQRDTAIYGTILLVGLAYSVLRRRNVRPLPWWAYVIFGIVPMGIDGGYQWITYILNGLYSNFPAHDTTPLLRVVTGTLFGAATVWLAYPYVQEAMDDFRRTLQKRFGWE